MISSHQLLSRTILGLLFVVSSTSATFGQAEIKKEISAILHNSSKTFTQITHEVDSIFASQDLGYPSINLDGDREKYERWKSFWGKCLDEKGRIVDFTYALGQSSNSLEKATEWCDGVEIDAVWTNVNYNQNMGIQIDLGRTTTMAFSPSDPATYFVGTAWGGMWKTTDGGVSYTNVNDRLPLAAVIGIYIDPNDENHMLIALGDHVWYGTNSIGIYETMDGGVTFSPTSVNFPLTDDFWIYDLTSNGATPNVLFAATDFGLIRSDDFFNTYTVVQNGSFYDVQFSQSNSMIGYASRGAQLLKTIDGGNTFSIATIFGNGPLRLDVDDANPDRVVVTGGNKVYYSTNGAATFLQSTMPESNCIVQFIPGTTDGIVIGNFEAYRSDDGGVNFYPITNWLGSGGLDVIHVDHRNSFTNPYYPDKIYLCNDGGIFRYNHTTSDFTNLSKDLIITQYYDIAISEVDTMIIGGGSQDNGNVTRNSNGAWSAYASTGDGMEQAIHLSNPNIRFWEYQLGGINRYNAISQTNVNIKPAAQTTDGAWHTPYVLDYNNHNRIVCGYQRVYESFDLGNSWNYLGSDFTNGNTLEHLAISRSNSDFMYAATNTSIWRKTNVQDWTGVTTPAGLLGVGEIVIDNSNPDVVYISSTGFADGLKVWKSIDGGNTWDNITYDLPNFPAYSLSLIDSQLGTPESGLFMGTIGSVFYLPEGGNEWFKYGCLPATHISDIEIQYSTNKMFIGTHGRGIFETKLDNFELLSTNELELEIQIEVYPNPGASIANVKSELNFSTLIIYDQSLRKVGVIKGSDIYKGIDIKDLNAGIYFFTFETEAHEMVTKRFVKE